MLVGSVLWRYTTATSTYGAAAGTKVGATELMSKGPTLVALLQTLFAMQEIALTVLPVVDKTSGPA